MLVRRPDDDGVAHGGGRPKHLGAENRALDLLGADAVAGDVDDVVRATVEREGAVLVLPRVVALRVGEAAGPLVEVDLGEAAQVAAPGVRAELVRVAPDGLREVGVGLRDDELALLAGLGLAPLRRAAGLVAGGGDAHLGVDPRERPGLGVGLQVEDVAPGAGEDDAAVLRGPVGVDVALADLVHGELLHGGADGLGAEGRDLERRHVVGGHVGGGRGVGHDRLQEGGAGLEDGRAVPRDDGAEAPGVREERRALGDDGGDAHREGRADEIALTGDPARVGDDVEPVALLGAEDGAHGVRDAAQPTAVAVHDALRLPGRTRGVDDEAGPVGAHGQRRVRGRERGVERAVVQRLRLGREHGLAGGRH